MLQLPQILGPSALSCPQARKILKTLAQKWLQCVFESLFNWKEQNILSGVNESCRYFSTKLGPIDASRVAGQFVLKWWYLFKGDYIWAFLYKRKIVYILYCAMLRSASTLTNSVNFAKWRKAPIGSGRPINIHNYPFWPLIPINSENFPPFLLSVQLWNLLQEPPMCLCGDLKVVRVVSCSCDKNIYNFPFIKGSQTSF